MTACAYCERCWRRLASLYDNQVALPLAQMSAQRVTNLYDLMDAGYDSKIIADNSRALQHVPLIDPNPRRGKCAERVKEIQQEKERLKRVGHILPETVRFRERSTVERVFGRLKDEFGARHLRVRGHAKARAHLMLGLLVLTADQLGQLAALPPYG